ncbi:probable DNA metabolism protein [Filimonas lacunae]|uniref:Probable DNA metabolism protein n=1 Tax=Filimonas lacunae TaxID=477680 RepID=A0A173MP89_9BACT|nr:TIGR03915 family putative DNA repair protein [Filimonas lacunae]BAV09454.1 domain often clustered or fused with uracil-DNA glycosylase [Filimonas lacunae]SIS73441.1 probable DNA metabolism protein [Filimonas lacunae]
MHTLVFDGSFQGLLSAVFTVFEYKLQQVQLVTPQQPLPLFGNRQEVITHTAQAQRVWNGLLRYISPEARQQLYKAFLSEQDTMPQILLTYMQYAFAQQAAVEKNFSHPAVLAVHQTAQKVHREKHRMEAFVRFHLTKDQLYYAVVEPDFNVLPLISEHFEKRYADQQWMIYDARRKYGIYYDLTTVTAIEMDFNTSLQQGRNIAAAYDEKEEQYQHLWQQYFAHVNIAARKNTALHIRHMPLRYWKYLPEKQPAR